MQRLKSICMKKIKVLIDSDIILDCALRREHGKSAQDLISMCDKKKILGYVTPIIISNTHYIIKKYYDDKTAREFIKNILEILSVLTVTEHTIKKALTSDFVDYEDSIQNEAAIDNGMDYIITRNLNDYKKSKLKVLTAKNIFEHYNL